MLRRWESARFKELIITALFLRPKKGL
jgi:hypothetical protein